MVYIININGEPLMPSTRYRHIKQLIKCGKAVKISSKPFTVRLLYETSNITQPIILGIDPGRTNIGVSAVTESGIPVFEAELITRNKQIPKLMQERAAFRMTKHRALKRRKKRIRRAIHAGTVTQKACAQYKQINTQTRVGIIERILPHYESPVHCIGIKNKEARFLNRARKEGWLTPTANHLLQTHVNLVRKLMRILPISVIVLEINKFDFAAMDNPRIKKWEYGNGQLKGFASIRAAIEEQQEGHCILCTGSIDHLHHLVPRSKGGSNTLPNIAGLCEKHHRLVHTDEKWTAKLATKKAGINKKYGALSVLNQIIPHLLDTLSDIAPVTVTSGKSTYQFRLDNGINKTHNEDAYCIACSILENPTVVTQHDDRYLMAQFRRHDRQACLQERVNRYYMLNGKIVATNRHKAMEQSGDSLEDYVNNGGRVDCLTVKPHPATYKNMHRALPGAIVWADSKFGVLKASNGKCSGHPKYYEFTNGDKALFGHCKVMAANQGIVFIAGGMGA